jgi:AmmeMemoRadiSam system protein B
MVRQPAVAGYFYPAEPDELSHEVDSFLASQKSAEKLKALGCVVPHAGYRYSGRVAGSVFARLELPQRFVILCPRHYPQGAALAVSPDGEWLTPLGTVPVDGELSAALRRECPGLCEDRVAHSEEHALEVQLPFLQRRIGEFRFVPIAVGPVRLDALEDLGHAMARVIAAQKESVLIVASSDMNHYESDPVTRVKDRKAIERILALDARGLYNTVQREDISMCGVGPATAMLTAVKELGATRAIEIQYATSGDADGRRQRVVGYAGIAVQ